MRVLIDACVLFPTVLREITLGVAETGAYEPLWSPRILEEWRRAAARHGRLDAEIAAGEIARLSLRFPKAEVAIDPATEARLSLPDADDIHVLAAAIDGGADELLTLNTKDFPLRTLAAEGITRRHPDEFLLEAYHADPVAVSKVAKTVADSARAHGIDVPSLRHLMKRARLPRLGKALDQA